MPTIQTIATHDFRRKLKDGAGSDAVHTDPSYGYGVTLLETDIGLTGTGIAKVKGHRHVEGVALCDQSGEGRVIDRIDCDVVAMSGGWSPVVHLYSHCGGKLAWDAAEAMFRPDPDRPPLGADGKGNVIQLRKHIGTLAAQSLRHYDFGPLRD